MTPRTLDSQTTGHVGMYTIGDGSLIVKPAFPSELLFYQTTLQNAKVAPLRPHIPNFFGALKPGTQLKGALPAQWACASPPLGRTQSLILENLSHHFLKPNLLDIKLGTVFHDESTSPEKILRMEKTARETTSLETGVRLAEFQVYNNLTSEAISTPKSFGKALKPAELPDGIARFFPTSCQSPEQNGPSTCGLPRRTLLPILYAIRDNIIRIREAYSSIEMRMVGASLLIIYEADWYRAAEGTQHLLNTKNGYGVRAVPPPCTVKLIDFAHTRLAPGEGPDKGVLRGMDTMVRLLEGRIMQVTAGESK